MTPGIYNLPAPDYRQAPGISKSMLDQIALSPAHLKFGITKETDAMRLGSAAHCAALEPMEFDSRYARANGRRKTDGDKIELTSAEWETCLRIRDAVWNHPTCQDLFSVGIAEQSAWWIDPKTLMLCKCRPDWSRPGLLVDLKTTTDASPRGFFRSVSTYRYHVQAAFYLDGWRRLTGDTARFIFVAVEKTPPYAVGFYDLSPSLLDEGCNLYRRDLALYENCLSHDTWPGYSNDVITIERYF